MRGIVEAHTLLFEVAQRIRHDVGQVPQQVKIGDSRIHPLYKALILIVDRHELRAHMDEFRRPGGYPRPQDVAHFRSILIARTGAEDHSSGPISSEALHSKAVP